MFKNNLLRKKRSRKRCSDVCFGEQLLENGNRCTKTENAIYKALYDRISNHIHIYREVKKIYLCCSTTYMSICTLMNKNVLKLIIYWKIFYLLEVNKSRCFFQEAYVQDRIDVLLD